MVSLYLILINIFRTLNLTELALVSTPYIIVLVFWSIYLFFSSFINKYAALFISLISCLSNVFLTRSSSLSFDTDPFNIFFLFLLLFILSLYLNTDLNRKKFYLISISFILTNLIFIFHYPKTIFGIIFIFILVPILLTNNQKILDNFIVCLIFISSIIYFYQKI